MDVDAYLDGLAGSLLVEIEEWARRPEDPEHPLPRFPYSSVVFAQARGRLQGTLEALARAGAMDAGEVVPRMARFDDMLEERGLLRRETRTQAANIEQRIVAIAKRDGEAAPPVVPEESPAEPPQPTVLVAVVPISSPLGVDGALAVTALSLEVWSDRMRFHYVLLPTDAPAPVSSPEHWDAMSTLTRQHRARNWDAWDDTGVTYRTLTGGGSLLGGPRVSPPMWAESVVLSPGPSADATEVTIRGQLWRGGEPVSVACQLPAR